MEISLKHTHCEPDPKITEETVAKLRKLERFLPNHEAALAKIELERAVGGQQKGDIWRAEITVTHHGEQYRAESTKTKLDHAVTTVLRDISGEMRRAGEKRKRDERRGGFDVKSLLQGFGG